MTRLNHRCPNCNAADLHPFYQIWRAPAHSVLLLATRQEAIDYPAGNIRLGFCPACGFICNMDFNPALHEYSTRYEATQGYSSTFNAFHQRLARQLIERHNLRNRHIIEIGCGQGEFLTLLCQLGQNYGVGFDPAYRPENNPAHRRLAFIQDFYSERYSHYQADFVCCKMTLEHIPHTADFVSMVRRAISRQPGAVVFFQVPDTARILRELAFWDVYYEHCSYFSRESLARLFSRCGFEVLHLSKDYDGQYLMLEAKVNGGRKTCAPEEANDLAALKRDVDYFARHCPANIRAWQQHLEQLRRQEQRVVIWGAGSKGVSFLTTLGVKAQIEYAVDINPNKHGAYMAGTGQKIVGPDFLTDYQPDVVIVMNPIYCPEIQQALNRLKVTARLVPATGRPAST